MPKRITVGCLTTAGRNAPVFQTIRHLPVELKVLGEHDALRDFAGIVYFELTPLEPVAVVTHIREAKRSRRPTVMVGEQDYYPTVRVERRPNLLAAVTYLLERLQASEPELAAVAR